MLSSTPVEPPKNSNLIPFRKSRLAIFLFFFALFFIWFLSMVWSVHNMFPNPLGAALGDPCGEFAKDFWIIYGVLIILHIGVVYLFRYLSKILLSIAIPLSLFINANGVSSGLKADDSISSYGYLARECYIFQNPSFSSKYAINLDYEKEWKALQEDFFNRKITEEEFERKRADIIVKEKKWKETLPPDKPPIPFIP